MGVEGGVEDAEDCRARTVVRNAGCEGLSICMWWQTESIFLEKHSMAFGGY